MFLQFSESCHAYYSHIVAPQSTCPHRGSFAVLTWLLSSLEARYPLEQDRSSYHSCIVVLAKQNLTEVMKNTVLTVVSIGTCERETYT